MDFFSITQWVYPILELIIMVMCFTMLRCSGGILLGTAFLIMSITSLSWPVLDLFMDAGSGPGSEMYYEMSSYVAFILYLASTILIIIGIVKLSDSIRN